MIRAAVILAAWLVSASYVSTLTVRAPERMPEVPAFMQRTPEPPRDVCPWCLEPA